MAIAGRVAIVPKGDWSANATYKRLDAVTYNNTLYFAKKEVPAGTETSNTEYWSKSIVGGAGAIATKEDAGIVKPADGLTVAEDGTLKVSIDGTTLTMDQVNNVIRLADTLKEKINGAFPAANLINNLTTTEAGFGLDARQGKALDDKITEINGSLTLETFTKRIYNDRTVFLTGAITGDATVAALYYPNSIKPQSVNIVNQINIFNTGIADAQSYSINDDILVVNLQQASVSGRACGAYVKLTY